MKRSKGEDCFASNYRHHMMGLLLNIFLDAKTPEDYIHVTSC